MWSSAAPAVTCREAVPVLPLSSPVTVCGPAAEAVQVAPVQDPFGAIEKVVGRGHVAERVVELVAALGRVGLRTARRDRRRGRREHEVIEAARRSRSARRCPSCRRRCRSPCADRSRSRCSTCRCTSRSGRSRRSSSRSRRRASCYRSIEALGRVGLRTAGGDRGARRADHDVVQPARQSPARRRCRSCRCSCR